ncbi:hypothetical protein JNL27_17265 [bacterium]|nr:hypothetical protein [bacterium]
MPNSTVSTEKFAEFILPDNFVQFLPLSSEIIIHESLRGLALDKSFFNGCINFIKTRFPKHDKELLYRIGFQWGDEVYSKIERLALLTFPEVRTIKDLSMDQFHQLFTNYLAALGWGNFELKRRDDFLFVDLHNSILVNDVIANATGDDSKTACELYAGFFAGIFSRISNMNLSCVEITCKSEGYEWCSFLLDNDDTIGMVNTYIKQHFSPLEAFQKIKKEIEED